MRSINEIVKEKPWVGWVLFTGTVIVVFLLGLLASSIVERRSEALFAYVPVVDYPDWEPRNEVWGQNFPRQYQSYLRTSDTLFRSKYNSSHNDDMLEAYPALVILWAGYPFSRDYNQARGHYYAITDVQNSLRIGAPTDGRPSPLPNTCWTCKSTDVPRLMSEKGIAGFYAGTIDQLGHEVSNHIGCTDCHDAKTMNLRITRPALIEAFEARGEDITKATHQEMRSLVCAQCHSEYYFDKKRFDGVNYLVFPWKNGFSADEMESFYDEIEFADWIHPMSKAPMLKAQHPDYEVYLTGVHAQRGVSCADCHMPYKSEGGQKFTDHHIRSPLANVANSCQVCHREETDRLVNDVYARQTKITENRVHLEHLLVRAHFEAKKAWELGATETGMKEVLQLIRHAQWRWDYVAAGHGNSFHSSLESMRLISTATDRVQEARLKLSRILASRDYNQEVPLPDISTKAKAQAYIGLDMEKLWAEKAESKRTLIPHWIEQAKERHARWDEERKGESQSN